LAWIIGRRIGQSQQKAEGKWSLFSAFGFFCALGNITPAIKYLNIVIPAKAGIQVGTGCRIKSGMTELDYLVARLISTQTLTSNK